MSFFNWLEHLMDDVIDSNSKPNYIVVSARAYKVICISDQELVVRMVRDDDEHDIIIHRGRHTGPFGLYGTALDKLIVEAI